MRLPSWIRRSAPAPVVLEPRVAYAQWAASYPPHPHNALMTVEQTTVDALLPDLTGCAALDAGCGTGRYLRLLHARGARRVVGIDFSPAMLAAGASDGLPRALGDLRALPLASGSVDVAVSGLALNDLAQLSAALGECARVLRPGGVLVYSVVHPRGAALGWTRAFDTPDGPRAVEAHWHARADHERACAAAGLDVQRLEEPAVVGPGGDAGPVALVVQARRRH